MSPSPTDLPTIVLVPGACHPPSCFHLLTPYFRSAGYETVTASLPSFNPTDISTTDCNNDMRAVRAETLKPLIEEQGRDVVLLVHSYGSIPGAGAATGLSKSTRLQEGKAGGVMGMVFLSAVVVKEGETLLQTLGGDYPPCIIPDRPAEGLAVVEPAIPTLLGDSPPELAVKISASFRPHSKMVFESACPPQAWAEEAFMGRLAFIRCTIDATMPPWLQDMYLERSGVDWLIRNIEACHDAFISRPEELAGLVVGFAKDFSTSK